MPPFRNFDFCRDLQQKEIRLLTTVYVLPLLFNRFPPSYWVPRTTRNADQGSKFTPMKQTGPSLDGGLPWCLRERDFRK
jgi:hypothetical protein